MRQIIHRVGVSLFFLAGYAGAGAASMSPSECVRSMENLEKEVAALQVQLNNCKKTNNCQQVRVKLCRWRNTKKRGRGICDF